MADLMRTSNPALNAKAFQGEGVALGEAMTLKGTVNKTGLLLICVIATAAWTWNIFMHSQNPEAVMGLAAIGGIGDCAGVSQCVGYSSSGFNVETVRARVSYKFGS